MVSFNVFQDNGETIAKFPKMEVVMTTDGSRKTMDDFKSAGRDPKSIAATFR